MTTKDTRRLTETDKRQILRQWEESGETGIKFAKRVGISNPTLYTWRKLDREGKLGNTDSTASTAQNGTKKGRIFSPEQRIDILNQWKKAKAKGESTSEFTKRVGVATPTLYFWKKQARKGTRAANGSDHAHVPAGHQGALICPRCGADFVQELEHLLMKIRAMQSISL